MIDKRTPLITYEQAREAFQALVDEHFHNASVRRTKFSIPAEPDDTDLLLSAYLEQQRAEVSSLESRLQQAQDELANFRTEENDNITRLEGELFAANADIEKWQDEAVRLSSQSRELQSLNDSQAETIGGFMSLRSAAIDAGISFSWEDTPIGKKATAYNERAEAAESRLQAVSDRWIPVEEKLPPLKQIVEVITFARGNRWLSWALRYLPDEDPGWLWSFVTDDHICLDHLEWTDVQDGDWKVSHWRPLPAPPTEPTEPKKRKYPCTCDGDDCEICYPNPTERKP